jgi:ABC-type Zn2+ transport system substrate-binding protein/surface adhesin
LNREYLPDDDDDNDGHNDDDDDDHDDDDHDDHDDDEDDDEDDYIIEMKKGLLSMMSMNVYISNTLTSQHSLLKRRISYCSNTCKRY